MPDERSIFARTMAAHNETVVSPDGNITAIVSGGAVTGMRFRPGSYRGYTDPALATELTRLAKLVWVSRLRARHTATRAVYGDPNAEVRRRIPSTPAQRRVRERTEKKKITVSGAHVRLTVLGGTKWTVYIEPGTIDTVAEEAFIREFAQLVKQAISTWRTVINLIRREEHGPSFVLQGLRNRASA